MNDKTQQNRRNDKLRDLDVPEQDARAVEGGQKRPERRAQVSELLVTKRIDSASSP